MIVRPSANLFEYKLSFIEQEIVRLETSYNKNPFPLKTEMMKQHEQGLAIIQDIRNIAGDQKLLGKYHKMSHIYFSGFVPKFLSEAKTIIEKAYK